MANFYAATLLFFAFCSIASTVYVINDLKDKAEDSLNPYKKLRPIAANLITEKQAYALIAVLLMISVFLSAYIGCALFVILYLLLNIIYSYFLRKIFYIDACCIALGFIIRVVAAFYLLNIPVNFTILLWMFFTSCFFTFMKRKLESDAAKSGSRNAISKVKKTTIKNIVLANAFLSFVFLTVSLFPCFGTVRYAIIILVYALLLGRLLFISLKKINDFNDPIHFVERDAVTKILIVLFLISLLCRIG